MNGHGFYLLTAAEQTLVVYDTYANLAPMEMQRFIMELRQKRLTFLLYFIVNKLNYWCEFSKTLRNTYFMTSGVLGFSFFPTVANNRVDRYGS